MWNLKFRGEYIVKYQMGVHVSSDPCHWPMRALVTSACSPIGPHYQTKPHNVLSGCNDERVQASTDAQSPSVTLLLLQAIGGCSHITWAKVRGSWTPPPPFVSFCQHLPDAPFVLQFSTWTFLLGILICMGPICMLHGFDEHVWLNLNQFSSLPAFFYP